MGPNALNSSQYFTGEGKTNICLTPIRLQNLDEFAHFLRSSFAAAALADLQAGMLWCRSSVGVGGSGVTAAAEACEHSAGCIDPSQPPSAHHCTTGPCTAPHPLHSTTTALLHFSLVPRCRHHLHAPLEPLSLVLVRCNQRAAASVRWRVGVETQ